MSILRTLNTGATGLTANGDALGVVGDNISNTNTIGFKRSRAVFQDLVANAGKAEIFQVGAGARLANVEQMWQQGALLSTESPTDLALSGEGFFVVQGNASGVDGTFYTRAGQFHIDNRGYMVNTDNLRLQGYLADDTGTITGALGDIRIGPTALPATASQDVSLAVNLDSNAQPIAGGFDPANPALTSNFSTSTTIYDSLGNGHQVTTYFNRTNTNSWDWHAMVDGGEIVGGTAGTPYEGANGSLTFDTNGALDTDVQNASSWDFNGATAAQTINFDFGTSITGDGGTGLDGTTNFAAPSTTNGITQNGFAAGSVNGVSINETGVIVGVFSNGQRRVLGQVAVAAFRSQDGLSRAGQSLWVRTEESGEALIGSAGTAGRGSISAGTLEQSNVDVGREFVDLIAYQRGFQASSKVVQTADELYGELVNLRR
jgi:flagellar hook protein FlgE